MLERHFSISQVSLKELLSVSIDLAATGGSNVRRIQERALRESKKSENENALHAKSKGQTKEGANEVVTEGDLNSHRAIVYGFNKAFPGEKMIFVQIVRSRGRSYRTFDRFSVAKNVARFLVD